MLEELVPISIFKPLILPSSTDFLVDSNHFFGRPVPREITHFSKSPLAQSRADASVSRETFHYRVKTQDIR